MPTILQLRKASGKSRARVAADLNMSERHLYRLERSPQPLRTVLALAFAAYYGIEPDEITEHKEAAA